MGKALNDCFEKCSVELTPLPIHYRRSRGSGHVQECLCPFRVRQAFEGSGGERRPSLFECHTRPSPGPDLSLAAIPTQRQCSCHATLGAAFAVLALVYLGCGIHRFISCIRLLPTWLLSELVSGSSRTHTEQKHYSMSTPSSPRWITDEEFRLCVTTFPLNFVSVIRGKSYLNE